jgi:hypothetical protein
VFDGECGNLAVNDGGTEAGGAGGEEMRLLEVGQQQMQIWEGLTAAEEI